MSVPQGLPERESKVFDRTGVSENDKAIIHTTESIIPKDGIAHFLPEPPRIGKHKDDLLAHQDRINAIDNNLLRAGDIVQKVFSEIGEKIQKVSHEKGGSKEWPKLNLATEKLVRSLDIARSQASQGKFAQAQDTCSKAWEEFQKEYTPLEKELSAYFDEKIFDKKRLSDVFNEAKDAIGDSFEKAMHACKDCDFYLSELNKAASMTVRAPEKSLVDAAAKDLREARESLQKIWDGKKGGDIKAAKAKVREAAAKYHTLTWHSANDKIAKTQNERKARLAAAMIPIATQEIVIELATRTFGTLEKPAEVEHEGRQYEVAHDMQGHLHVIQLPAVEDALGKGFSNVVVMAYNTSKISLQALRKSRSPEGQEVMENSLQIHRDITGLQGTTAGPEAVIRKGRGGVLSSVYGDNALGWLKTTPPPEYRWKAFRSAMRGFIEFARDGNVHGDITLVNVSVGYEKGKDGVYAKPTILKLEDLDGSFHIREGYDKEGRPIYSEKAITTKMTPAAYGTPEEIMRWLDCLDRHDLEGLAQVRFPQDILSIGITLYQLVTGDIDLNNIYLHMERTPINNKPGEDGEFKNGTPNVESIRLALEDYGFLTEVQKDAVVKVIAHAITLNPAERAKLQDLEKAMTVL